jgi:hypothetical protein
MERKNLMFKDVFNQYKNLTLSDRIYYLDRKNSNIFTGKATEDIVKEMIHVYSKKVAIWKTLYNGKSIVYILGYDKDFDYDSFQDFNEIYNEDNTDVIFLLIRENHDICVKKFNEDASIMEYLFDNFIKKEYTVDLDRILSGLQYKMDNVHATPNQYLENYISYMNQGNDDDLLYKYESFIFNDLFRSEVMGISIFSMNFDIICGENSIVECKGKTRAKDFIINKWEFEQLKNLYIKKKCAVNIYVLLSDNEFETRNNLLLGKGLDNDVQLITMQFNQYTIDQFKLNEKVLDNGRIERTYTLPYKYFEPVSSPILKDLKKKSYDNYINTRPFIPEDNPYDIIKDEMVNFFKKNPIFKDVTYEHKGKETLVRFDDKTFICKFVFDRAWSSKPIIVKEFESYKEQGVTHIAFFKFYKKADRTKCYDFLGYESLEEFVTHSNKISYVKDFDKFPRNNYLEHINRTKEEHEQLVNNLHVEYCYRRSLVPQDIKSFNGKFNMKEFTPLHPL